MFTNWKQMGLNANQNVLATWTEVKTLHKQRTSYIRSSTQTTLDLWNAAMVFGILFKHRNPRMLSSLKFCA
jgi:hypothetical protein